MRSRIPFLCAVALLCTVAIAAVAFNADDALQISEPSQISPSKPATSDADDVDEVTVCVYPVSDLTVWRYKASIKARTDENGRVVQLEDRPSGQPDFDATLLISKLKSSMGDEAAKHTTIAPHQKTASLVIRATRTNHERIAELLESLRRADRLEEKQKVSGTAGGSDRRLDKLPTVPASERADRAEDSLKLEQPVVAPSTSQAKEYDDQLLLVIDAISKSERLATTNVEAARKAIETAHLTLRKSSLAWPLKSRLEDRLDEHQQGLERRRNHDQHFDELGGLFNFELGAPILPSQPKLRPLTPPSTSHRKQPFGVDSLTHDQMYRNRPSRLYLDQEVLAEKLTAGRSRTNMLRHPSTPYPVFIAE